MLTAIGQEDQRVLCIDDVTSKELPWSEMRQARDQNLKYVRDLGVCGSVDERSSRHEMDRHNQSIRWRAHANQFTNCGKRIQKWRSARSARKDSSIGNIESHTLLLQRVTSDHSQPCTSTVAKTSAAGELYERALRVSESKMDGVDVVGYEMKPVLPFDAKATEQSPHDSST